MNDISVVNDIIANNDTIEKVIDIEKYFLSSNEKPKKLLYFKKKVI